MGIIDSRLEFADAQVLAASGNSTNVIDFSNDRDMGPGRPLFVVISLDAIAKGSAGDETYIVSLQTDDNVGIASPATVATVVIPRLSPAGSMFAIVVAPVVGSNERFFRLAVTLGGTAPTVTYSSWITSEVPRSWQAYDAPFQL
jgi:hypothetical protein